MLQSRVTKSQTQLSSCTTTVTGKSAGAASKGTVISVMAAGLVERLGKAFPVTWGDVTRSDLCSRPCSGEENGSEGLGGRRLREEVL